MAKIQTDTIAITMNKLVKDSTADQGVLSNDQIATLREVIEATVAELLDDPSIVVEVDLLDS